MILVMTRDCDSILFGKNGIILRFPLNMLQCNGFRDAIVIVEVISSTNMLHVIFKVHITRIFNFQDSAKTEVAKIPEKYGLSIKLEVISMLHFITALQQQLV